MQIIYEMLKLFLLLFKDHNLPPLPPTYEALTGSTVSISEAGHTMTHPHVGVGSGVLTRAVVITRHYVTHVCRALNIHTSPAQ